MQASPQFATSLIRADSHSCASSSEVKAQQFVGADRVPEVGLTDAEKRQAIDRAARLVERTFLNMHFVGGLQAATAYADARNTWALMLMTWGHV